MLYSDSTTNECTYVHCLVTSRHLIACNMQEHLLQIMQMIQYRNIRAWKTVLTTVSIGNQFGFDKFICQCVGIDEFSGKIYIEDNYSND